MGTVADLVEGDCLSGHIGGDHFLAQKSVDQAGLAALEFAANNQGEGVILTGADIALPAVHGLDEMLSKQCAVTAVILERL